MHGGRTRRRSGMPDGARLRAVIFAAGELLDRERVRALVGRPDLVICADGGLRHARALGLRVDLLLGDFDSLDGAAVAAARESGVPVLQVPVEKDKTDSHIALEEALRRGGAAGGGGVPFPGAADPGRHRRHGARRPLASGRRGPAVGRVAGDLEPGGRAGRPGLRGHRVPAGRPGLGLTDIRMPSRSAPRGGPGFRYAPACATMAP